MEAWNRPTNAALDENLMKGSWSSPSSPSQKRNRVLTESSMTVESEGLARNRRRRTREVLQAGDSGDTIGPYFPLQHSGVGAATAKWGSGQLPGQDNFWWIDDVVSASRNTTLCPGVSPVASNQRSCSSSLRSPGSSIGGIRSVMSDSSDSNSSQSLASLEGPGWRMSPPADRGEGGSGEDGYQWLFDILDELPLSAQPRALAQGTAAVVAMHEHHAPTHAHPSPSTRYRPVAHQSEGWGWFVEEDKED